MKSDLKSSNLVKYLIAIVILYLLYSNIIPNNKLPKSFQNIYVFIGLGLLILVFYDLIIKPSLSKKYSETESENFTDSESENFTQSLSRKKDSESENFTDSESENFTEHFRKTTKKSSKKTSKKTKKTVAPTPTPTTTATKPTPTKPTTTTATTKTTTKTTITAAPKAAPQAAPKAGSQAALTEEEIKYYINLFVSNLNNKTKMNEIHKNIQDIQKTDNAKGKTLSQLMNLVHINPELSLQVSKSAPLKLIDIVNAMDSSLDINKFIVDGSNKKIELDLINSLQTKIINLENIIKKEKDEDALPKALSEIIGKNKYVDSKGMIQDLTYGDVQFTTQLSPGQMQALGSYDNTFNNKWDNAYTILNTEKWRPRHGHPPVCKQEKVCPVCPTLTTGYPLSVMDFDKSRSVMGPDGISVGYINKLNNPIKP